MKFPAELKAALQTPAGCLAARLSQRWGLRRSRAGAHASGGGSSLQRARREAIRPRRDRSRPSRRWHRVCAIAFAGKESSDADDPNDHSVADALVRCALPERRKQSSGGTVADLCLWANRQAARSPTSARPARLLPQ
jgi:hypothetical protein